MLDFLNRFMIGTPDFGHSDVWHFNFPLKFLLSVALKNGYFPLWSKDIGTGFPLLGEGQIGMFNLANMIIFRLFNPVLAFNLSLIIIVLTVVTGTYLFCRSRNLDRLESFFAAVIFSLSGVFVTQFVHFNLIQAASFLPWELFLVELFLQKKKLPILLALAFVASQQIYSGFQQSTLISLLTVACYLAIRLKETATLRPAFWITASLLLGFILAAPQIIATVELIMSSDRSAGVNVAEIARFPFVPKNLLSFFNPYLWGDPRLGTYPAYSSDWGIFWESTGYIGILPLFLAALAFLHQKFRPLTKTLTIILILSLILLLGKYTPLFFLFQLPPLSLFRVPARFLLPFVFALTTLSAIGLQRVKNKGLKLVIVAVAFLDLLHFSANYHPVINAQTWLQAPELATIISSDPTWSRTYAINPYFARNKVFLTTGWQDMGPYFQSRNSLDPNENLFWGLPNMDSYAGLFPKRASLWRTIFEGQMKVNFADNTFGVSTESAKMLSLAGVKYLTSPLPPTAIGTNKNPLPIASTSGQPGYLLYINPAALPHAYLTRNFVVADTIGDLWLKLTDPTSQSVVLEGNIPLSPDNNPIKEARVTKNTDLEVDVAVESNEENLLILSDSYYPGWQATINNQPTKIYPANLNERAVIVPAGSHQVNFRYRPLKIL